MTEAGVATPAKELVSLTDTTFSTGLIERSAAAFASAVPEGTGDDGLFGPASVTWRMTADLASPVAGNRPADSRTWPPHRDDVLIVPRTGHVKCDAGRTPSAASR